MSRRGLTITGSRTLRRALRKAPDEVKAEVQVAVADGLEKLENAMLAMVPRDTGDLAETIKSKKARDGLEGRTGPGVRGRRDMRKAGYRAHFAEFGTVNHPPHPFVRPALQQEGPEIRREIAEAIRRALVKLSAGRGGPGDAA